MLLMAVFASLSGFSQDKYAAAKNSTMEVSVVKIIKYYPNPATTVINFDFQKNYDKSYSFQIFNILGKKVLEISNLSINNQVNLNDLNRGVYIFQLRDKNGKIIESGKFQVSK